MFYSSIPTRQTRLSKLDKAVFRVTLGYEIPRVALGRKIEQNPFQRADGFFSPDRIEFAIGRATDLIFGRSASVVRRAAERLCCSFGGSIHDGAIWMSFISTLEGKEINLGVKSRTAMRPMDHMTTAPPLG